tara:strand:+ start:106 stop:333 length:228 start_codon:yes stop_codon:yes gene_type:complete
MFTTKITIIALAMCATLRVINAAACTNQDGSAVSAFADPALAYEECDCGYLKKYTSLVSYLTPNNCFFLAEISQE